MNFNKIKEAESTHYMPFFTRDNIAIERGEGNCLYDVHGNKYVDFVAGIATNILGYNHPEYTRSEERRVGKECP